MAIEAKYLIGAGLVGLTLLGSGCGGDRRVGVVEAVVGASDDKVELTDCRGDERWKVIRSELRNAHVWHVGSNDSRDWDTFNTLTCQHNGPLNKEPDEKNATVCRRSIPVRRLEQELKDMQYPGPLTWRDARATYERASCPELTS
jgi:hypothetical protein